MLHPATVPYVELPTLHVAAHLGVHVGRLLMPPPAEEGLFHDDKLAVRILCQAGHDSVKDKLHCSHLCWQGWGRGAGCPKRPHLYGVVCTIVVFIHCLKPTSVVVGMADDVDIVLGRVPGCTHITTCLDT